MRRIVVLLVVCLCLLTVTGCAPKYTEEELIDKARSEIPISNVDTIELSMGGYSSHETNRLFWFVSGNEYQSHTYTPIEFVEVGENQFEFVKTYKPIDRTIDISALMWKDGYSFIINNKNCHSIIITDSTGNSDSITVEELPFVYYYQGIPSEYTFVDENGIALN